MNYALSEKMSIPLVKFYHSSLSIHMILGVILTLLAPLQVILGHAKKWIKLHRVLGYIIVFSSFITAFGGLTYIFLKGTIGGQVMNIGFTIYGFLVMISSFLVARYARLKEWRLHRAWSLRLFLLAIGSWLYRVCYGVLSQVISDPFGSKNVFQSPIDYFMDFSFYAIPLFILELYLYLNKTNRSLHPLLLSMLLLLISTFFIIGTWVYFGKMIAYL